MKQFSTELQEPISVSSVINMTNLCISVMCAYICILFHAYVCIHLLSTIPAASPSGTESKLGDYNFIFSSPDIIWIATLFGLQRLQGNV